jgi:excisionase family DNA binding protein
MASRHGRPTSPEANGDASASERVPDVLGEILTAQQLAEMLRMQRSTIEDYGRRGVIPSIKLGRHRRYIRSDVARMVERLRRVQ